MGQLKLLTYNVKLLPDIGRASERDDRPFVRGASHRGAEPWWELWMKDEERTRRLVGALGASDYDVLCLQEVFDEDRRGQLMRGLERAGYGHFVEYSSDHDAFHEDSGLFFASRFPINWHHYEEFSDAAGSDALADKGVSCVSVNVAASLPGTALIVFNTHMQANNSPKDKSARLRQIKQLGKKIGRVAGKLLDPKSCAIVVCGDFNITAEFFRDGALRPTREYARLGQHLGAHRDLFRKRFPAKAGYTVDGTANHTMMRDRHRRRLDYVFAVDAATPPADIDRVRLQHLKCSGAAVERFFDADAAGHLSDHFGVGVTLELPP